MNHLLCSETTIAIILGASDWVNAGLGKANSFKRSANYLHQYLLRDSPGGLGLSPELLLDLFDDWSSPSLQLKRLRHFVMDIVLERRNTANPIADILIYYIGHGTCNDGNTLHLLVRETGAGMETESSISTIDLAKVLMGAAPQQRRICIFDCCFSEKAVEAFACMGVLDEAVAKIGVANLVEATVSPARGTMLLCSSPREKPSIGIPNAERTLFTGSLLKVLEQGVANNNSMLSFSDVKDAVYEVMLRQHDGGVVPRPALHQPHQQYGDLTRIAAFPNAWASKCLVARERRKEVPKEFEEDGSKRGGGMRTADFSSQLYEERGLIKQSNQNGSRDIGREELEFYFEASGSEQLMEDVRRKEEERLGKKSQRQEEERLAEEAWRQEEERLADEARRQEEERLAEEARRQEEERLAEKARRQEEERLAEEARRQEEERLAEEARRQEKERLAEEARRQEEERLEEEAKREEEERLEKEAWRRKKERLAKEAKREEQVRQAKEAMEEEDARLAAEAKREKERLIAQRKRRRRIMLLSCLTVVILLVAGGILILRYPEQKRAAMAGDLDFGVIVKKFNRGVRSYEFVSYDPKLNDMVVHYTDREHAMISGVGKIFEEAIVSIHMGRIDTVIKGENYISVGCAVGDGNCIAYKMVVGKCPFSIDKGCESMYGYQTFVLQADGEAMKSLTRTASALEEIVHGAGQGAVSQLIHFCNEWWGCKKIFSRGEG